jgi:hypothetical protein
VSSWQILAGPSAAVLSPATNPIEGSSAIVVHSSFPYFAVRALDATGAVLATSTAVSTPAHLTLAGSTAFVPRQGPGGLPVGCYKPTSCHVSATLSVGRLTVARTGSETVPFGGGMLLFKLTPAGRRDLTHSHHLSVRATVRDVSGLTAVRNVNLVAFSTSGRSPARSVAQSPSIHLVGLTDYVSNGWVGGILSSCRSNAACRVQLTILSGKTVIARSGNEFLGANEMGYLTFSLTAAGHRLLTRAPGNQLVARVLAANGSDRVNARVVLVAFH